MFLSFLKSMQTKSQDAQNPGLWVNGMRQPIRENEKRAQKIIDWNHNGVISKAENELTDFAKGQIAADDADRRAEHYGEMNFDERQRARMREAEGDEYEFHASADRYDPREGMAPDSEDLHNPGKISSFTKKKLSEEHKLTQDEIARRDLFGNELLNHKTEKIKYTREPKRKAGFTPGGTYTSESGRIATMATPLKKRADTPESNKPKSISDQKKKSMQENTNRSMFLTHLQGMQTKSQDAQNPGLWVNGMRQPMHENSRLRKDLKDEGRVIWTDRNERVANKVDSMYPIPAGTMQNSDLEKDRSKAFWHLMKRGHPKDLLNTQGKPAGAQDLNADGQVSKAEKELSNNPEDPNYDPGKALMDYADSLDN